MTQSRSLLLLLGTLLLSSALLEAAAQRDNVIKVTTGRRLSAPPPRGVRRSPPRGVRTESSPPPAAVASPSPSPSPSPAKPSPSPSPSPAAKPSPAPAPTPAAQPSPSPAAKPSPSPSPAAAKPSPSPVATPSPSPAPVPVPSPVAASPSPSPKPSPAPTTPPRVIRSLSVSTGGRFTCVLADGEVKCFGQNDYGQLGLGDTDFRGDLPDQLGQALPEVDLGAGATVVQISTGTLFSCAIITTTKNATSQQPVIKCWGYNAGGQLGQGDDTNRGDAPGTMGDALQAVDLGSGLTPLYVGCGGLHACALLRQASTGSNVVKCWGVNYAGQLGLEDMDSRGDKPGQMGDDLPVVNLGSGLNVTQLSVGGEHNCVLVTDAQGKAHVKCWGSAEMGQVGYGDTTYRGDVNGTMGDELPFVDLGTGLTPVRVVTGQYSSCAILRPAASTASGSSPVVKCWGSAEGGQLGTGDEERRGDGPDEMGDNLLPLDFGSNLVVLNISLGLNHGCTVLANTSATTPAGQRVVKCWGLNDYGELGYGDEESRGNAPGEMGDDLPAVELGSGLAPAEISCNSYYSCAVLQAASGPVLKCWGENAAGQLGLGDTNARGDEPNEMGANLPAVPITF